MTNMPVLTRCCLLVMTILASAQSPGATRSSGCGQTLASGIYRLTDQNVIRTYRILVPLHYQPDAAYPLVIAFHGWGGDENEFLADSNVSRLADERGYIVAAPRGLGSAAPDSKRNSWSFRGSATGLAGTAGHAILHATDTTAAICDAARTPNSTYPSCKDVARNICSWTQCQADDVAFAIALVGEIESKLCVDAERVFASGGSNGGMFTWELGQNPASAPTFRAIASLIGLPHRGYLNPPGNPLGTPVLVITGMHDTTVPPGPWESTDPTTTSDGGAYYYTGASAIIRSWGPANSCAYQGERAAPFAAGTTEADCRTYCGVDAAGWSGGSARVGWPKVLDCRAAMGHVYDFRWTWKLILDFFDAQSR